MYTSIRKYWSARMQLCVFKTSPRKDEHTRSKAQPGSVRSVFRLNYFESWPISNEPWLGSNRTVKYETAYWYRRLSFGSPWINRFCHVATFPLRYFLNRCPFICTWFALRKSVRYLNFIEDFYRSNFTCVTVICLCEWELKVSERKWRKLFETKIWNDLFFRYR